MVVLLFTKSLSYSFSLSSNNKDIIYVVSLFSMMKHNIPEDLILSEPSDRRLLAYLRVSTLDQMVESQRDTIRSWAKREGLKISEWIVLNISTRSSPEQRKHEVIRSLKKGDILVASELSRIGRNTLEIIELVRYLVDNGVRCVFINNQLDMTVTTPTSKLILHVLSALSELERDLISIRTKEGLASLKARGLRLGKPIGTIQRSKLDVHRKDIEKYCLFGVSYASQARMFGVAKGTVQHFCKRRCILLRKGGKII